MTTMTANRLALLAVLCWSASTTVPQVAAQPMVQPCVLCPEEGMTFQDTYKVLIPGQELPESALSRTQTCGFLQTWATSGGLSDEECQALVDAGVDEACACGFPPVANTESPASTTEAPAAAAPVEDSSTMSSEDFYIGLQPVSGEYSSASAEGLTMACESLFGEYYPKEGLLAVTCDPIATQRSYAGGRRRRQLLRPAQQEQQRNRVLDSHTKLEVIMRVTVELSSDSQPLEETEMLAIWNDNEEDFINSLKTEGSTASQLYFSNVTMMEVTADDTLPKPVVEEPASDDGDDGLSDGAQAGIIVAAVVVVVVAAFLLCRGKKQEPTLMVADPVDQEKNRSRSTEMMKSATPTATKSAPKSPKEREVAIDPTYTNDSDSGDKISDEKLMNYDYMYETVTVTAPAGKLGIHIDKSEDLMVVREVKSGSILENQVFDGDIIVGLNDQDTGSMSTKEFKQFLMDTEGQQRTLTIKREVDDSMHC